MVERKTTRDFIIEGDNYIAIKTDEYINGKGQKMVQRMEEHNITIETVNEVLDTLAFKELEGVNTEIEKLILEKVELEEEVKDFLIDPEYIKFKQDVEGEKMKVMFETLKKEGVIEGSVKRLADLEKTKLDIISWETQFKGLKEKIEESL